MNKINSLHIQNLPNINNGATGTVLLIDKNTVVKTFNPGYPFAKIEQEFNNSVIFNQKGLPSPRCYEIVKTKDSFGIIYERIHGITLTEAIKINPSNIQNYVHQMIRLMRQTHQVFVNDQEITSAKTKYFNYVLECAKYYTRESINSLCDFIESIPNANNLLHGDFHTGNVMVDETGKLYLIDFAEVCYGHPIFDIIAEGAVIPVTLENDPKLAESYLGISSDLMVEIWKHYISCYFNLPFEKCESLSNEARIISRLRNAITAAITDGIPEDYLIDCATNTNEIFIPQIPALKQIDWNTWR